MNTKLTLTIEQKVVSKAKVYAKRKGHSLSDIIENYLKVVTQDGIKSDIEMTPIVKSLRGSIKAPSNFNYKKNLSMRLSKKYM